MILRPFMKHVNEQNWLVLGLDVVVVGIFLGILKYENKEY